MMYDKQFVLAILHAGSPVREIGGKVTLPFNSEYKVRLKNKNNVRAKARVWIDGRKASTLGDFILNPGETLDLERFLDESMSEGRRFKFVPLSDRRVNDPTDHNNGEIKVEFYLEQVNIVNINWNIPVYPLYPPKGPAYPTYPIVDNTGTGGGYRGSTTFTSNSTLSSSERISSCNLVSSPGQAGATVEGSNSDQSFEVGDDFQTDILPTTLTLRVRGPKKNTVTPKPKPRPSKFCGECGTERLRRRDKFCRGCGRKLYRG